MIFPVRELGSSFSVISVCSWVTYSQVIYHKSFALRLFWMFLPTNTQGKQPSGTATKWEVAPISIPAASGLTIFNEDDWLCFVFWFINLPLKKNVMYKGDERAFSWTGWPRGLTNDIARPFAYQTLWRAKKHQCHLGLYITGVNDSRLERKTQVTFWLSGRVYIRLSAHLAAPSFQLCG